MTQNTDLAHDTDPPVTAVVMVFILTGLMWGILAHEVTGSIGISVTTSGTVSMTLSSASWVMA